MTGKDGICEKTGKECWVCQCSSCKPKNSGGGGCAITTAACQVYDMDDNCEILSTFRDFRDTEMMENPKWRQLVEIYYKISPDIVKKLNERQDRDEIYRYAMENFIKPAYEQMKKGNSEKAIEIYAKGIIFAKNIVSEC